MPYLRGDVVYVPFRYSELTGGKVRPALVVSSVEFHTAERLYIVAAIISNLAAHDIKQVDIMLRRALGLT